MEEVKDDYIWKNYRIMLHNLTDFQKERILTASNIRRFLYNWALEICNKSYEETGKIPNYQTLSRLFTEYKKMPGNEWLDKENVTVCRYAFIDLANAFHKFFNKSCKHPIFKCKKSDSIRFAVRSDDVSFKGDDGRYAFIPVLSSRKGDLIDCGNHNIPFGKGISYKNTRIKFDGNNYWLSLSVKVPVDYHQNIMIFDDNVVGIDVGIRTSATLSNGKVYNRPDQKKLSVLENRRRKIQSAVDRDIRRRMQIADRTRTKYDDIPKSKNQIKREARLAKTRIQIHNVYNSHYHKISRDIINDNYDAIVLETLDVQKMVQNSFKQARHEIYESRIATLAEYIEYKAIENGITVIKADKEFPSSQICSNCENSYKIKSTKTYKCPCCGFVIDRDLNASINLKNFGLSKLHSYSM